jgi:FMN-dependent NADH-azoreductase
MQLLHLDSSANHTESLSRQLTALYAETWRRAAAGAHYRHRDLVTSPIPPLNAAYCTLGRRVERRGPVPLDCVDGMIETPEERQQWASTRPLIEELRGATTLVAGVPMYNFGVPAAFKAWLDRVSFPSAFHDPRDGGSLLRDTRVVLVCTRGGAYGAGSPMAGNDFQIPYLRAYLAHAGVREEHLRVVEVELTAAELLPHLAAYRSRAAESLASARAQVIALAREHGR